MNRPRIPLGKHERFWRFGVAGAALLAGLWLLFAPGLPKPFGHVCGFRALTGLPCALCGGTRALRAASAGDFQRSLTLNPAALPVAGLAGILVATLLFEAITARRILGRIPMPTLRIALAAGFGLLLIWWATHAWLALKNSRSELVDPHHPVVRFLRSP